ncbi:MAG: hypothetical protein JWP65_1156 [Ramlibacter sp.]|jgi:hypothetical protein|nr:hypothetical protein [Ramlibacter sp.]
MRHYRGSPRCGTFGASRGCGSTSASTPAAAPTVLFAGAVSAFSSGGDIRDMQWQSSSAVHGTEIQQECRTRIRRTSLALANLKAAVTAAVTAPRAAPSKPADWEVGSPVVPARFARGAGRPLAGHVGRARGDRSICVDSMKSATGSPLPYSAPATITFASQ